MLTAGSVLRQSPGVIRREGELAFGDATADVSTTAMLLWDCLDGHTPLGSIASEIGDVLGEDRSIVLDDLARAGLILLGLGFVEGAGTPAQRVDGSVVVGPDPASVERAVVEWVRDQSNHFRLESMTPGQWVTTVEHLGREQLLPAFGAAASACGWSLPEDRRASLESREVQHALLAQDLEIAMLRTCDLLTSAGIEHRVLKGMATSRLQYRHASLRPSGDVDLLVRRSDLQAAADTVIRSGGRRHGVEIRPGFDAALGKSITVDLFDPPVEIDLHADLVWGPYGVLMDTGLLFDQERPLRVGGDDLLALSTSDALLHACYTAVVANWRVRPLALLDLVQIAPHVDVDRVASVSARWRSTAVVVAACRLVMDRFGDHGPAIAQLAALTTDENLVDRLVARSEILPHRNYLAREALAAALQPNWARRRRYAAALLLPERGAKDRLDVRIRRAVRASFAS